MMGSCSEDKPAAISRSTVVVLVLMLLFAGAFVRFANLGKASYAIDEAIFVQDSIRQESFKQIYLTELNRIQLYHHLPLVMMIMRATVKLSGFEDGMPPEWLVRAPFAMMGVLTLWIFYLLGRSFSGAKSGLWVMFLATFSFFHVFHSREAYDYILLVLPLSGVLWSSVELLKRWLEERTFSWTHAGWYMFFSTLVLQSHLSGLLFLPFWNLAMGIVLLSSQDSRKRLWSRNLFYWVLALSVAYLVFLPFLLKLLSGGFQRAEAGATVTLSPRMAYVLLGAMGWGLSIWAFFPFVFFLVLGVSATFKKSSCMPRWLAVVLLAQFLVYVGVQTWSLRVSRFEVRYYAPAFPIILFYAGLGICVLCRWLPDRVKWVSTKWCSAVVAGLLFAWFIPTLWCIANLEMRMPYNSKAVATWIMSNLPENGIYVFRDVDQYRAVPGVYPTPGRFGIFPILCNSTPENYKNFRVRDRLIDIFQRFPLAVFVQRGLPDLLGPPGTKVYREPVPREMLFARKAWLKDEKYQLMNRLRTNPLGDYAWGHLNCDHQLFSYNLPEDLPAMARGQGRQTYHYFGPEWGVYSMTSRRPGFMEFNHWRYAVKAATLVAGNATGADLEADLEIYAFSPNRGCELGIVDSKGNALLKAENVGATARSIMIPGVVLSPGDNELSLSMSPCQNAAEPDPLLVYGFRAVPKE